MPHRAAPIRPGDLRPPSSDAVEIRLFARWASRVEGPAPGWAISAPIGPGVFPMERRSRYETRVYADLCPFSSVDTTNPTDKLRKDKKGLKTKGFHARRMISSWSRDSGAASVGDDSACSNRSALSQRSGSSCGPGPMEERESRPWRGLKGISARFRRCEIDFRVPVRIGG